MGYRLFSSPAHWAMPLAALVLAAGLALPSPGEAAESTNPSDGLGVQEPNASAELHEPNIEPAALEDAPGS